MKLRDRIAARATSISPPEAVKSAPMRGLGDLIAKVADPIAKAIGMDKTKCGCGARQAALNARFPFTP